MKKNEKKSPIQGVGKTLRLGLVCLCLLLFASERIFALNSPEKITLNVVNAKLVEVLEEVKRQSGYDFMYNEKLVKGVTGITMNVKEVSLDSVMRVALRNTNLTYEIRNKIIVISEKNAAKEHQFTEIRGMVKDETGLPMPGVTILLKGTTTGVASDAKGNFVINVPRDANQALVFSFIGMETKEVKLTGKETYLNVVMKIEVGQLEEVVVSTGYTQTTKKRATGSVAVVNRDVFENKVIPTVDQLLQGQVAGVSIVAKSGRPGESAKIRIRGTNTLTGDAEPLWVVDGVPLQRNIPKITTGQIKSGDFNDIFANGIAGINPNDIENVTILKDASAAAIYGSRAAGGVIVVTTKSGKSGKMSVNYAANISIVMKPSRDANLMNAREKLAWEQELWDEFSAKGFAEGGNSWYPIVGIVGMIRAGKLTKAGDLNLDGSGEAMTAAEQDAYIRELGKTSTDWFDELFRTSFSMNHYLSLSGGSDKTNYYLSIGYSKDNGILKKSSYDRYNLMGKLGLKPVERLSIDFGFDLSQQRSDGSSLNVDPFKYAYFANPYEKPYNEDGSYRPDFTYYILDLVNGGKERILPPNGFNVLREIEETSSKVDDFSMNLRLSLNYKILSSLSFSGLASYSFTDNRTDNINGPDTYAAFMDRPSVLDAWNSVRTYGSITQTSAYNMSYMVRGQLNYSDIFAGIHRVSLLAGAEIRGSKGKSIYEKRYGYDPVTGNSSMPLPPKEGTSGQVDYSTIISLTKLMDQLSGQSIDEARFASFYAALDYSLYDKYVANLSFRTDGSNNFGSDEQFNPTWSLGLAWHIGDEEFMDIFRPVLSRLKLSLAMGYTGNISKTIKPDLIMSYSSEYRKTDMESFRMGSIDRAPNPNLRWEKTKDMKVAVDFGLFDNRINGLFEAYYRLSSDVVSDVDVPYSVGFRSQGYNTSEIENKGLEATLQALIVKYQDFRFNASVNVGWNRNILKEYQAPQNAYGTNVVGYPLGSIFSGKPLGINPKNGLYTYKLRPDADILQSSDFVDRDNYVFYRGTSTAPVTGGFNLNFTYRTWSLSVGGSYSLGSKIVNEVSCPVSYSSLSKNNSNGEAIPTSENDLYVNHLNVRKDRVNRWTEDRTTGVKYPRIIDYYGEKLNFDLIYPTSSGVTNGSLLENNSYLKVRNISLSYALPEKYLKRLRISSLSVSAMMTNLFTITNYSGIDPEVPGATYPLARTFSFGVNLGF